jgi:hypothetical protein
MGYLYPGAVCTAAGWGQTSDGKNKNIFVCIMKTTRKIFY